MFKLLCKVAQALEQKGYYVRAMIDVLRNADDKVWTEGALVRLSPDQQTLPRGAIIKPIKYCAMGLLACKAGLINKFEDQYIEYKKILYAYNLDQDAIQGTKNCPMCNEQEFGLDNLIVHLNDHHSLKFTQVAEQLDKVEF